MSTLASLSVRLGLNPEQFSAGLAKARSSLRNFQDDVERNRRTLQTFGNALTSIGKIPALVSLAGSAVALTGAVKPAAGALWLLPGAAAVGAAAATTLKVGLGGVSDAFKAVASGDAEKAAEAMEKLAPAAQSFVKAGEAIRVKWQDVRKTVQGKLFDGLAAEVSTLGNNYLPILEKGMGATATSLNGLAREATKTMNTPFMQGVAAKTFDQTAKSMADFKPAIGPLISGLGGIVQAGLPLIGQFTAWAGKALATKAAFLSTAEGQAWLTDKMNAGVEMMRQLGRIAANLGKALSGLFTGMESSTGSLLTTLEQLTAQFAAWTASAEGQEAIKQLFDALVSITQSLLVIIPQVAGALGILAGIFASLPGPVQSVVGSFIGWSLILGPIIARMAPLFSLLVRLGPLLTGGAAKIVLLAAKFGLMGTAAATSAASTGASALAIVASWVKMAAAATVNAARTAGAWLLTAGANAATAVATMVATAARIVAQWVLMAAQAMARAAVMAASWLVAMGPIGWVIAAVVGLVALIIANWDKVKAWTISAWNAVSSAVSGAWNAIVSTVSGWIAKAVAFVVNGWNNAKSATSSAWNSLKSTVISVGSSVVSWVAGLPGRLLGALASLGSLLVGLGNDLVQGLWRGIQAGWSWLTGAVSNLARSLLNVAKSALGIASPSKLFRRDVGRWIPEGLAKGILGNTRSVVSAAADMARKTVSATDGLVSRMQSPAVGDVEASYRGLIADAAARTESAAREVITHVTVNNPRTERASDSIARELRDLSAMGAFAGRG